MSTRTRRRFVSEVALAGAAALTPRASAAAAPPPHQAARPDERISFDGIWEFRQDADGLGDRNGWHLPGTAPEGWVEVPVPHTWQITPASAEYYGVAWYRRRFAASTDWQRACVRLEFQAVFHSARAWVNGQPVGAHLRKGYTAFTLDVTAALRWDQPNLLVVRVENAFDDRMLPRGRSSDWTHDGGIYRPVTLVVSPPAYIERVEVEGVPVAPGRMTAAADVRVAVAVRNTTKAPVRGSIGCDILDPATGEAVLQQPRARQVTVPAGESATVELPAGRLPAARLWHFDQPDLYAARVTFEPQSGPAHRVDETFGVRTFEARDGGFFLNGERVRLMGVERMAGSHPDYGMAEPGSWIEHDHADLKHLNCVLTRVHWMQDRRVLDYCDRHGILMQLEVPTWGSATFEGMGAEPIPALMQNGLEQLREMIEQNRNHPSIVAWGLCNEIGGQNPPAYAFATRMREEAKRLDPRRPVAYASHSLRRTPERDVTQLMDIVEWNEYWESWQQGTLEDLRQNFEAIKRAFPGKPIVVSEYGYCACTADRPEGDGRRAEILRTHTAFFRDQPEIAGLIFFCYNDYRTHVGDRGKGVLKQRVHGVVDLYGARKRSYDLLRDESSPVESLDVSAEGNSLTATVRTRASIPAHVLTGYRLRWVVYAPEGHPVEQGEAPLPAMAPGSRATISLGIGPPLPSRVRVDVVRPTGFSARASQWRA